MVRLWDFLTILLEGSSPVEARAVSVNIVTVAVSIVLIAMPLIPLLIAWYRVLISGGLSGWKSVLAALPLIATSASCGLFILGLFYQWAIGPDYSARRFITIYANLTLNLATAMLPLIKRRAQQAQQSIISISGAAVALAWFYLAVVSSVV